MMIVMSAINFLGRCGGGGVVIFQTFILHSPKNSVLPFWSHIFSAKKKMLTVNR